MSEQNLIAIQDEAGVTVNVDPNLLREYYKEAAVHLNAEADAKVLFKLAVEAQAETLGIKKSKLSKFYKTRYKAAIEEAAKEAETFQKLEEAFE